MVRRVKMWRGVAVVFTLVNLGGAGYAAMLSEWSHAGLHVVLTLLGVYAVWRLFRGAEPDIQQRAGPTDERIELLQQSVDAVALEVERIGEAQRFNAKRQAERADTPK
ncbi:MAG: hypothetical protein IPP90_10050 [Gemmatimonadaceae bacterium]|nr:hypothetical protein [Gemmatimonadaceae bacterium]